MCHIVVGMGNEMNIIPHRRAQHAAAIFKFFGGRRIGGTHIYMGMNRNTTKNGTRSKADENPAQRVPGFRSN